MIVTKHWIEKNYNIFNKRYFDGVLPIIKFKISNSKRSWGYATYVYDKSKNTVIPEAITISNYYDSPEFVKMNTLLHEMIHIYEYYTYPERFICRYHGKRYDAHGEFFQSIARRLNRDGWKISKYVDYESIARSHESKKTIAKTKKKINSAVVLVCHSSKRSFVFKTDINKLNIVDNTLNKNIESIEHVLKSKITKVSYYKIKNEALAKRPSCVTRLCGWVFENDIVSHNLQVWKATPIKRTLYTSTWKVNTK